MIAVLIPAHNEAGLIGNCLRSILAAAAHDALAGEPVLIIVAADRCTDLTTEIAHAHGAVVITVPAPGGVGMARAAAAKEALRRGARWLAMTDADSVVPADWLSGQLRLGADVFCGVVQVADWLDYAAPVQGLFDARECSADGHARIHGANLGVSAHWYVRCGGFLPLETGEDVALVRTLYDMGARIGRFGQPMVTTSARRIARARDGFSNYLRELEASTLIEMENLDSPVQVSAF